MGFGNEFRQFALRGNVIDLAIGIIIGAAFGKIISSLVDDIITPAILNPALNAAHLKDLNQLVIPGTAIKYGNFISQLLSFVIITLTLFLIVKGLNRMRKPERTVAPEPTLTEKLLAEIRDELKK